MKTLLTFFFLFLSTSVFADSCVSGDCNNGYGTYVWDSGEFKGDKYVGENKNNLADGQGTYTYASGSKYVGEWKNDVRHGQGTFTFADGDKYVGEFKNGTKHGNGTYTFADGTTKSGIWKNDKLVTPN